MKTPFVDPRSKFSMMNVDPKRSNLWIKAFCTIGDNITNKKIPFKNRIQGVVKKFKNYRFSSKNFVPTLYEKEFNFRNLRLTEYLKGTTMENYFEKGLPLPLTSVSKIVGVFKGGVPFKVDNRLYCEDDYVWDGFNNRDLRYDMTRINHKTIIPGSWKFSNQNLVDMATPKTTCYSPAELINGIFSRVGIDFKLPFISYWKIDILNGILTKSSAFPGLLTSKLIGSTRHLTTSFMKTFTKNYFYYVIKRYKQVFDLSLITVGGREKRVTFSDDYKILKTRVVLMMEDVPTLLCQSVAIPLTKAFQKLNEGYNFIGRSLEQRNHVNVSSELLRDPKKTIVFNADFSGHDNHVDEYQLVVAFGILRLCFPAHWKFMDKLFYYFLSSMVCKFIVIPGSNFIYRLMKGIATGHPFTSLVNTTVAYCTFATAIYKVSNYEEICDTRLFVAGDDVIGVIPLSILEKLSIEMSQNSGMKIDPISDHCGPLYSNDPLYQRSFLKKKFTYLGVAWNDYELLDNLYNSASGRNSSTFEINRIIDMLMNGPCDFSLNNRVKQIVKRHLIKPRYRGLSLYAPPNVAFSLPKFKYSKNYLKRSSKRIFTKDYRNFLLKKFNTRMLLAFRWFNMGQPFPALGYKDDSYWIDATKNLYQPVEIPYFSSLRFKLRKYFSIKWLDLM